MILARRLASLVRLRVSSCSGYGQEVLIKRLIAKNGTDWATAYPLVRSLLGGTAYAALVASKSGAGGLAPLTLLCSPSDHADNCRNNSQWAGTR